jgi:hypothetical protein
LQVLRENDDSNLPEVVHFAAARIKSSSKRKYYADTLHSAGVRGRIPGFDSLDEEGWFQKLQEPSAEYGDLDMTAAAAPLVSSDCSLLFISNAWCRHSFIA